MTWPLMRRRTFMRRFTALSQSYRRSIELAHIERDKARSELQRLIDSLAPKVVADRDLVSGNLRIYVEIDRHLFRHAPEHQLLEAVRDSILRRLVEGSRDYRGDLRQTEMQRLLGV